MTVFVQIDTGEPGQRMTETQADEHPIIQRGAQFAFARAQRAAECGHAVQFRDFTSVGSGLEFVVTSQLHRGFKVSGYAFRSQEEGGPSEDDLLLGSEVPAIVLSPIERPPVVVDDPQRKPRPETVPPVLEGPPDAEKLGDPSAGENGRRRSKGGFRVGFKNMGRDEKRAVYYADERTIFINLEHPQIAAARGMGSTDDLAFRRLAYEVAFSEYAIALAQELASHGEFYDITDPIVEIRDTLNRVALKGAAPPRF